MVIRFNEKCELEIIDSYNEETDDAETHNEVFAKGEEVECDLVDDNGTSVNVQFADGSMLYCLPKNLYTVLPKKKAAKLKPKKASFDHNKYNEIRPGIDLGFLTDAELKSLRKILDRHSQHPLIGNRCSNAVKQIDFEMKNNRS